jgi:hypothetical protein
MTFEKIAARWWLHRFGRQCVELYMAANPDDPAVIKLRRSLAELRRTALDFVIDVGGTPRLKAY